MFQRIKNNFWLGSSPPTALFDHPSAHLSNKGALSYKQRAHFQEQFDSIVFILNMRFINFPHIFQTSISWSMIHNDVYDIKYESLSGKQEIQWKCI